MSLGVCSRRNYNWSKISHLAKSITDEVYSFEYAFESAPTLEKKRWIRRFVLGIHVDRDNNRAVCYIMKIPMVSHPTMAALLPSESSINVVAGAGSRQKTSGHTKRA